MVYSNMQGRACKHAARAEVAVAMCRASADAGNGLREACGTDERMAGRRAPGGGAMQIILVPAAVPMRYFDGLIKNGSNLFAAEKRWRVRAPRRPGNDAAGSDPRGAPALVARNGDVNLGEFPIYRTRGLEDSCCPHDLTRDGVTDFTDYSELFNFYDAADRSVDFNGTAGGFRGSP
ncbi:MAG: hypothetical protein IT436_02135 [Phycisphaerales bacterium]|nr:hypothetical protein [Phycisphaerales bacterium]